MSREANLAAQQHLADHVNAGDTDLKSIAPDLGFHLVYGVAAATAYKAL